MKPSETKQILNHKHMQKEKLWMLLLKDHTKITNWQKVKISCYNSTSWKHANPCVQLLVHMVMKRLGHWRSIWVSKRRNSEKLKSLIKCIKEWINQIWLWIWTKYKTKIRELYIYYKHTYILSSLIQICLRMTL